MKTLTHAGITIRIFSFLQEHNLTISQDKIDKIRSSETEAKERLQELVRRFGTGEEKAELKRIIEQRWREDNDG